jgi:alkylation response protein AidB-like acyl-CoA dehydrogenase
MSSEVGAPDGAAGFVEHVRVHAPRWREAGRPDPDVFRVLAATGFLTERWAAGRRAGLRDALDLVASLAPLDGGVTLSVSLHSEVFLATLDRFGRHPLAPTLFGAGCRGDVVGATALTEDGGGSDPTRVTTTAHQQPDGSWHVRGHKRYTSNIDVATHCLVLARAHGGERRGPTLFLVDLDRPGVDRVGTYSTLGTDSLGAWRLELDTVLPSEAKLGPVGGGLPAILPALRYERLVAARGAVSAARHALDLSRSFLRHRAGGEEGRRLYDHSALGHMLADAWIRLDAADALIERLVVRDLERTATDADYAAAKHLATTTASAVADVAIQLMGGRGYTSAFPHERIWRDIRLTRIGGGTDQVMLGMVARSLDRASAADPIMDALVQADAPDPRPVES